MISSFLFFILSCSCLSTPTNAFSHQLQMAAYKPPVKSSVSKIRSPRWSGGSNVNGGGMSDKPQLDSLSRQPSKQRASAAASIPNDGVSRPSPRSSSPQSSFQERMRGVMNEENERARIATRKKQSMPQNVFEVETLADYKALVGEESSKLVVVRFYAPWCRACKAIQPIFYKMAHQFPNVVFVDVPCHAKNANLHQGLGVPSLPYGHVYHPISGLVEETKLSRKQFPQLARKLQAYVQGRCDLLEVGDVSCPYLPVVEEEAINEARP
jgi:thiol-disulfide isomerase/thioredoxin